MTDQTETPQEEIARLTMQRDEAHFQFKRLSEVLSSFRYEWCAGKAKQAAEIERLREALNMLCGYCDMPSQEYGEKFPEITEEISKNRSECRDFDAFVFLTARARARAALGEQT